VRIGKTNIYSSLESIVYDYVQCYDKRNEREEKGTIVVLNLPKTGTTWVDRGNETVWFKDEGIQVRRKRRVMQRGKEIAQG
jgi:hypothetical protein